MASELGRLQSELDAALEELRELAHGLYPSVLASDGLSAALAAAARHAAIPTELEMADFPRMNEVYARVMGDARPARSTVAVAGLPRGVLVEIEAIVKVNG